MKRIVTRKDDNGGSEGMVKVGARVWRRGERGHGEGGSEGMSGVR